MKAKSFNRKLSLNKVTITNLEADRMNDAKGGITGGAYTCPSCPLVACPLTDDPGCQTYEPYYTCNPTCGFQATCNCPPTQDFNCTVTVVPNCL